jgi:hypothetical protein
MERGLNIGKFTALQYRHAYIDPALSMEILGYQHDNYDEALVSVIRKWVELNRK